MEVSDAVVYDADGDTFERSTTVDTTSEENCIGESDNHGASPANDNENGGATTEMSTVDASNVHVDEVEEALQQIDQATDALFQLNLKLRKEIATSVDLSSRQWQLTKKAAHCFTLANDPRSAVVAAIQKLEPIKQQITASHQQLRAHVLSAERMDEEIRIRRQPHIGAIDELPSLQTDAPSEDAAAEEATNDNQEERRLVVIGDDDTDCTASPSHDTAQSPAPDEHIADDHSS